MYYRMQVACQVKKKVRVLKSFPCPQTSDLCLLERSGLVRQSVWRKSRFFRGPVKFFEEDERMGCCLIQQTNSGKIRESVISPMKDWIYVSTYWRVKNVKNWGAGDDYELKVN
jgi:hypothetical protein